MKKIIKKSYLLAAVLLATIVSCNSDDDTSATPINIENLEVTIDENPTNGQVIGTVQSNSNDVLTYSITTQTPAGALSINATTGELLVADAVLFDFETNPTITAEVSSVDAVNIATITININNVNELGIQDFTTSIDENSPNGNNLGIMLATGDGALSFSITSQSPAGAIAINPSTGELTIANTTLFNFETNPTITANIVVDNSVSTETATATINLNNVNEIGDFNYGGVIFWMNAANNQGLVVSISDQSTGAEWGCYGIDVPGAIASTIGSGEANTIAIETTCTTPGTAADLVTNLSLSGYSDWFLPSQDELNEIYLNKAIINASLSANSGTTLDNASWYWTSTQQNGNANNAYFQFFGNGLQTLNNKANLTKVRAIRAFTDF
jgi:hypothetical protein